MKRFSVTLLALLCATLAQGCATTQATCHAMRPVLTSAIVTEEAGICINRTDTALLMQYIVALEECAR